MSRPEVFPPSPDYSGGDPEEPSLGSPLKKSKHLMTVERGHVESIRNGIMSLISNDKRVSPREHVIRFDHREELATTDIKQASSPQPATKSLTDPQTHIITTSPCRLRLFAIDPIEDEGLILQWQNKILPTIKPLLHRNNDKTVSISLLREGHSREESEPVIRVQTSNPRSEQQQLEVKNALLDVSPECHLKIRFAVGSVRRTHRDQV